MPHRAEGKRKIRNDTMKREMPQCISYQSQVVAYAPNFMPRKTESGMKITGHNTLQRIIGNRKIVPEQNLDHLGESRDIHLLHPYAHLDNKVFQEFTDVAGEVVVVKQ